MSRPKTPRSRDNEPSTDELLDTLEDVAGALRERFGEGGRDPRSIDYGRLTARESDVIRLIAKGRSNRQIADTLGIALQTAKNHAHRAMEKLSVGSRRELADAEGGTPVSGGAVCKKAARMEESSSSARRIRVSSRHLDGLHGRQREEGD